MPRLASRRRLREILHGRLQQRGDFGPIRSRCSAHQEPGHSRGNVEHLHALAKIELPDGRRTVAAAVDDAARSEMLHGLPTGVAPHNVTRSEEHTTEPQTLMSS